MREYEYAVIVEAPPDKVFDFVSKVENLPRYLPTVREATSAGGDRVRVHGEVDGKPYDTEGYLRVDQENRRMEWGSDGEHQYTGWLAVRDHEYFQFSVVTAHLSMEPSAQLAARLQEQAGGVDRGIQDELIKAVSSIQHICEGHGGKVEAVPARH